MSKPKHTPGPWKYKKETRTTYDQQTGVPHTRIDYWINNAHDSIALIAIRRDNSFAVADSQLIAAAPDLLAALEMVHSIYNDSMIDGPFKEKLNKAIAKAKGSE